MAPLKVNELHGEVSQCQTPIKLIVHSIISLYFTFHLNVEFGQVHQSHHVPGIAKFSQKWSERFTCCYRGYQRESKMARTQF